LLPHGWCRLVLTSSVVLGLASHSLPLHATSDPPMDSRRVKAAFVVSFLGFAAWPPAKLGPPGAPFVVAVIGDEAFAALVSKAAAGQEVAGRKVTVKAVAEPEAALDAHATFIGGSQAARLPVVLRTLASAGTLTIGDSDGFARDGVVINLYTFDKRVRIEVNSAAASRAGLQLSANLMRLARVVE
jgi:hypothetical protein